MTDKDKNYRDAEYSLEEKKRELKDLPDGARMKLDSWTTWNYNKKDNISTTTVTVKGITDKHYSCAEIVVDIEFRMLDEGQLTYLQGFSQFRLGVINGLKYSNKITSSKYGQQFKIEIPLDDKLLALFNQYRDSLS